MQEGGVFDKHVISKKQSMHIANGGVGSDMHRARLLRNIPIHKNWEAEYETDLS